MLSRGAKRPRTLPRGNNNNNKSCPMQYNEHQLAQLAATVAAGLARGADLFDQIEDREKTRATARHLARVSLLVARHILAGAHGAAQKVDELELLYDDVDFL
jgi:hypothetical protein